MQVILVVTQYKKIATIKKISVEIDPTSFVFVSDVHSVIGKGVYIITLRPTGLFFFVLQ